MGLNLNFISKFNHSFTNCDCLHCAILKALYHFKEKRAHKVDKQDICNFFLQNDRKEIFKTLEIFENNMKFTRKSCGIDSKISHRDKNATLMISLICHYCWSLSLKVFNAVELHFLKSLKVNCSNIAYSSSMRPIFDK